MRLPIALAALLFAVPASASDDAVSVATGRQVYVPGDSVEISVSNGRKGPIFLPGCGSFVIEVFDENTGRYKPLPTENCVSEGESIEVVPGAFALQWPVPAGRSGGILRVGIVHGWGCEQGRPLSQARCEDFGTSWSSSFRVGKAGQK
jgi:hypothetical protein